MFNLPKDPFILLSFINTHLRDSGQNLDELCAERGINSSTVTEKLKAAGFEYVPEINQFR